MSTLTAENILQLIEQLPALEQNRLKDRLKELTEEQPSQTLSAKPKAPRDKRVPCEPMPDRTLERQWVEDHKHDYAGQWVALAGDRLVAASFIQKEVFSAIDTSKPNQPLVLRVPSPDDLPSMGI